MVLPAPPNPTKHTRSRLTGRRCCARRSANHCLMRARPCSAMSTGGDTSGLSLSSSAMPSGRSMHSCGSDTISFSFRLSIENGLPRTCVDSNTRPKGSEHHTQQMMLGAHRKRNDERIAAGGTNLIA